MKLFKVVGETDEYVNLEAVRALFIKPLGPWSYSPNPSEITHHIKGFVIAGRIDNAVYTLSEPLTYEDAAESLLTLVKELGLQEDWQLKNTFTSVGHESLSVEKKPAGRPKKVI